MGGEFEMTAHWKLKGGNMKHAKCFEEINVLLRDKNTI